MRENDLAELEVEEADVRVRIKKSEPIQFVPPPGVNYTPLGALSPAPALPEAQATAPDEEEEAQEEKTAEITSPMVGTFYRSGNPAAEAYVRVGSVVDPDTVICIVEAMKVMNEIKAGIGGEIVEILAQNAEPVEFGQLLFLVRPTEE